MNEHDATRVLAILNAGFPFDALEPESVALYRSEIALLADADVATKAAHRIVRGQDRFPSMREFRHAYHVELTYTREERPQLPEPRLAKEPPEWVSVWWWARHAADEKRDFPQFEPRSPNAMTFAEYDQLRAKWQEAGAPRVLSVKDIVAAAT